jgi:hypothetical protein
MIRSYSIIGRPRSLSALAAAVVCSTLVWSALPARATSCLDLAADTSAIADQIVLAATGNGDTSTTNATQYAASGGAWSAERPVGTAGAARTDYSAIVSGSEIILSLRQSVRSSSSDDGDVETSASIKWKVLGQSGGPSTVNARITRYRAITWSSGTTATVTLDGTGYNVAGVYHSEQRLNNVPVDTWQNAVAVSGLIEVEGPGTVTTATIVVISIDCGSGNEDDADGDDEIDWGGDFDKPVTPCDGDVGSPDPAAWVDTAASSAICCAATPARATPPDRTTAGAVATPAWAVTPAG